MLFNYNLRVKPNNNNNKTSKQQAGNQAVNLGDDYKERDGEEKRKP